MILELPGDKLTLDIFLACIEDLYPFMFVQSLCNKMEISFPNIEPPVSGIETKIEPQPILIMRRNTTIGFYRSCQIIFLHPYKIRRSFYTRYAGAWGTESAKC